MKEALAVLGGYLLARCRSGTGCRSSFAARTSARKGAATSGHRTSSASTDARSASRSRCSISRRASLRPSGCGSAVRCSACSPRLRRCSAMRARLPRLREGRQDGRDRGGALVALAPLAAFSASRCWLVVFVVTRYASLASIVTAVALVVLVVVLDYPWPIIVVRSRRSGGGHRAASREHPAARGRTEHRFELGR